MFNGYKTYIGIAITVISQMLAFFGKDLGIDWQAVEASVGALVGAAIALYGYLVTQRGAK